MTDFFNLAGYDYDAPRGSVTIRSEDDGIRLFVDVYANTKNEEMRTLFSHGLTETRTVLLNIVLSF